MGKSIISRIDDMGGRIDSLEHSITDLLDVQGVERFDQQSQSHFESNDKSRRRHLNVNLNVNGSGLNMNQNHNTTARTHDE